jgi:hypothetical protein
MEAIMMRSAPRFPAIDEWARMSEVEQDTLILKLPAARNYVVAILSLAGSSLSAWQ